MLSFRLKRQTSKNVADTTFKKERVEAKKLPMLGYVKLIYHVVVLFKALSLHLFLKHIQEQSTRNSLMKGLLYERTLWHGFPLVHLLRTSWAPFL